MAAAADPAEPVPTADTVFRIASMTKSFTAAAVLILRDRGRVRLDDPVAFHVPELAGLAGPTADSPPITIRHLLSMAGGMASDDPWADRLLDADAATMDALFGDGAAFATAPGGFSYSNFGYAMLGRVVTNVAGMPFQDVITDELLIPLGLAATTWTPPPAGSVAPPYWRVDDVLTREPVLGDGGFAAMGGLWSTARDLARWCGWMLDAFPPRDDPDDPILARASRREMQVVANAIPPRVTPTDDGTRVSAGGYGFGLNVVVDSHLGLVVQHSGGLPGYGSHMAWLPQRGVAAVALANSRYAPARNLTREVLDLLVQADAAPVRAPTPPVALTAAATALVALLNDWSDAVADTLFSFNVGLDDALERRRCIAAERRSEHGPLIIRTVSARNLAEADVQVVDGRGTSMTLALMLSPEPTATVQWYELREPNDSATEEPPERRHDDRR
jgi:CubicO group peptidase (beta-lactamase class C family)